MYWLLVIGYWLLRLPLLTSLAVFTDEANYLDWGNRMISVPGHLFYSLYDAKQPLSMWLFGISEKIFYDPLFAGRLISVVFGFFSLLGIYYFSRELFNKKVALISSLYYLLSPLYLLFDRQALMESHLTAIGIWAAFLTYQVIYTKKLKYIFWLGIILGIGFWIKTTTWIWYGLVCSVLLYTSLKTKHSHFISWGILVSLISLLVGLPLFLQGSFWTTLGLNLRYSFTLTELTKFPLETWGKNLLAVFQVSFVQILFPVFILAALELLRNKKNIFLKIWLLVPVILQVIVAKDLNSRYLTPFLWPLLILAARITENLKLKKLIILLVVITSLPLEILQIINPVKYFELISKYTRFSYIEGYVTHEPSGWAIQESNAYLNQITKTQKIVLGLGLYSGNPEIGTMIYFQKNPNVLTTFFDAQLFGPELSKYGCLAFEKPVYLLTRDINAAGLLKFVKKLSEFKNPYGGNKHYLFTLKDDCVGKTLNLSTTRQQ